MSIKELTKQESAIEHAKNFTLDKSEEDVSIMMQYVAWGLRNPNAAIPSILTQDLGDRSKYIGASSATGCLRKSYLDVVSVDKKHSAKQMFVFERGHQLEEQIRKGFSGIGYIELDSINKYKKDTNTIQYVHQHEAIGKEEYNFLKAHIDFIFVSEKKIVIKEIKNSATIPNQPYASHILQTTLQMWLVKQQFPKKEVVGSVVYHNSDTGCSIDYKINFEKALLEIALQKAKTLWNAFNNKIEPEATTQLYCGKCPFKGNCSKIVNENFTDLPSDLAPMLKEIKGFRALEKDIKKLKTNFLSLLKATGIKNAKCDGISAQVVKNRGRKVVSVEKLKSEHLDVYEGVIEDTGAFEYLKVI